MIPPIFKTDLGSAQGIRTPHLHFVSVGGVRASPRDSAECSPLFVFNFQNAITLFHTFFVDKAIDRIA